MPTILIVDDQQSNREYLAALLGYGGHRLLEAADGADALAAAKSGRPDLIIADVLMPTMDGFELVQRLRAEPALALTPVIFWTAHYHERETRALADRCGVAHVITKPTEPEVVLRAVESALGLAAQPQAGNTGEEFDREHRRLLTDKLSDAARDLRSTNARLSALVDLNLQLASERDMRKLLESLGHAARQIVGARHSVVVLVNGNWEKPQAVFTSGMDNAVAAQFPAILPPGWPRAVLEEGRCVRLAAGTAGDRSWLGVPLASPERTYGYLVLVDRIGLEEFSAEDERLAGILAAQAGRIYQNGSLYKEVLQHASNLEKEIAARSETETALAERVRHGLLTGEAGAALTRCDSLPEMLQSCAEAMVQHLDATLARIWTFNEAEGVLELQASAGQVTGRGDQFARIPLGEHRVGRVAAARAPLVTNGAHSDLDEASREWIRQEGITAFAGYPLLVEDRLLGAIGVFSRSPINAATAATIGSVAHQIALGIERSRANLALREREERIRMLLDSTEEAIYGTDMDGRCIFANAACARLLRYDHPDRLLGRLMHALIHHTRADGTPYPADECIMRRALERGEGAHSDGEILWRADGTSFPAERWAHLIFRDGRPVGAVSTFIDITERRQLEEQFRQAQERLRRVVISSPAVLFTRAVRDGKLMEFTWASGNLCDLTGYSSPDQGDLSFWASLIHPDDQERAMTGMRAGLFGRGQSIEDFRFRHASGEYRWTRCVMRLIRDESGTPVEAVGAFSDITAWKHAEREQAKLREQLQQSQKLESVGRLAGGVAHDFNNLLTVINGYSDLVLKELMKDDPLHESIIEIRQAGQRAADLVRQLLQMSRKQVVSARSINLNDVIREVGRMLARVLGEDIRFESVLSPSLGWVEADPGQIHQVLMNLAVNARDAMPEGGTLLIETANADLDAGYAQQHTGVKPGPYAVLKVTDTGVGMTEEVKEHLFEPFFTTKKPGEGTGLGLATVYGIVKQSGGTVWVYSEPGRGTTFTIYLPRIEARAPEPAAASSGQELRGNETIFVVEDQDQLRKIAVRVLRGSGYHVLEAANPLDALLQSEKYDGVVHLLLTDVVMPGMTGPELAARIQPLRPQMKVVFMSGYSERSIMDRRILDSEHSFLQKPFSPDQLTAMVRKALGQARPAGVILVVDDEPGVRSYLRKILDTYQVLEAADGREAIEQIETSPVDLVLMDLSMPELEGIETIRRLRGLYPDLRIVAMSGQFAGMLPLAERLGAQASLQKPLEPAEVLELVARLLSA